MVEEERPVHFVFDVGRQDEEGYQGEYIPVSNEEWRARDARAAQEADDRAAQEAAETQLRDAVAAHPDPVVRELAARLGVG